MTVERSIAASDLILMLTQVPPDSRVVVNMVQNLLVLTPEGKPTHYVDFSWGELQPMTDTEPST